MDKIIKKLKEQIQELEEFKQKMSSQCIYYQTPVNIKDKENKVNNPILLAQLIDKEIDRYCHEILDREDELSNG